MRGTSSVANEIANERESRFGDDGHLDDAKPSDLDLAGDASAGARGDELAVAVRPRRTPDRRRRAAARCSPSRGQSARKRSARSDLPAPEPPRRRAARWPSATHVPCTSSRFSLTHASGCPYAAGSRITKRAPPLFLSPASPLPRPSPAGGRFSAHSRPPCATTICREMLSPSPEFWPKFSCGRSV